ncbi:MAG TPA: asparagine synthase C-terminal domain-containing protein [Nitrososphaeraceae archaeon]
MRILDVTTDRVLAYRKSNDPIPTSLQIEKTIRNVIRNSVQTSGADRIAIALSTGVDSNLIFSLLRDEYPNIDINCYSVGFYDNHEPLIAKQISESRGADFKHIVVDNPLRDLVKMISIVKEPRWNIYQYYFIKEAKSHSNVLFTGDGGDESFAGYTFRYRKYLSSITARATPLERTQMYLLCHERDWVPDQEDMFTKDMKFSWLSIYEIFEKYFNNPLELLDQILCADYNGKLLHDFVPTNERYFKYFEIKGEAPLLDDEVVRISLMIPPALKYDFTNNVGKIPLRTILKRNSTYKFIESEKIGYGMDLNALWSKEGREIIISNMENGRIFKDGIINHAWYCSALSRVDKTGDQRYISKLLQLLSLEIWYKLFITRELKGTESL